MHFSAKRGIAIACRPSVRPSVTLVDCDHSSTMLLAARLGRYAGRWSLRLWRQSTFTYCSPTVRSSLFRPRDHRVFCHRSPSSRYCSSPALSFVEKEAWAYPVTANIFRLPLLSQKWIKLRTSDFVRTFIESIRTKDYENF